MKVTLIEKTAPPDGKTIEEYIAWCARVSNPESQERGTGVEKLLRYMWGHGHVSPFDLAHFTFEVETSRDVAHQILRHWSLYVQEWSQRYSPLDGSKVEFVEARMVGSSNRQGSVACENPEVDKAWRRLQEQNWSGAYSAYTKALAMGIAPEYARKLLPLQTRTTMILKGSLRDWTFYLKQRNDAHAQPDHRRLAAGIQRQLAGVVPLFASVVGWTAPV